MAWIFVKESYASWIRELMRLHENGMIHQHNIALHEIMQIKSQFQELVIHNADHEATRLIAYCPLAFSRCLSKAFLHSPKIFARVYDQPVNVAAFMRT